MLSGLYVCPVRTNLGPKENSHIPLGTSIDSNTFILLHVTINVHQYPSLISQIVFLIRLFKVVVL